MRPRQPLTRDYGATSHWVIRPPTIVTVLVVTIVVDEGELNAAGPLCTTQEQGLKVARIRYDVRNRKGGSANVSLSRCGRDKIS